MAGRVRVEILPWAKRPSGKRSTGRLVLTEEIKPGDNVGDLFARLASRYTWFGEMVFDDYGSHLSGHVSVIHNDLLLQMSKGLATELNDGDTLTLVHALAGGGPAKYGFETGCQQSASCGSREPGGIT